MIREKDIVYSNSPAWVWRAKNCYYVMVDGVTHAASDSAYEPNEDGLSIAKVRCDYFAKKGAA